MSSGRSEAAGEGQRALVLGATSLVAGPLLARLVEEGVEVTAVSRRPPPAEGVPTAVKTTGVFRIVSFARSAAAWNRRSQRPRPAS